MRKPSHLEFELGQSAAILALSSALCAFSSFSSAVSFFGCSISLLSCFILCWCAILRVLNSISLCSNSIALCASLCCSTFLSIVGCQLSLASRLRQGGKEAPDYPEGFARAIRRPRMVLKYWSGHGA